MATASERIKAQMQVLAPGARVVKPRQRGEIYGLRLHDGLAVPAVIALGAVPDGFHKGATVLVPYGPPQPVDSDPASVLDALFRWGAVPPTEPVLRKRLIFHDVRGGSVRFLCFACGYPDRSEPWADGS